VELQMTTTAIGLATGTIGVPDDSDWFKVSLNAGTQYVFTVSGGSLSGGQLTVYDANGNPISINNATSSGQINFEPTSSGTFYVGITGAGGATGSYTILESTGAFDFAGNINTVGAVAVGGQTSGFLANAGQNDWFKVTLTAGNSYQFTMTSANSGAQVALYNSSGAYIVSGNDGNTLYGNTLNFTATTSGTYYVAASDTQNGTGLFTVSATAVTNDFAGNTSTTGTVAVGGTVTGNIANVGQNDWFKISLTAGKEYVFDLTASGGLTPGVTLYDANGNALVSGFKSGANGGALVSFEPTVSGTYYVGASGILSTTGGYSLAVSNPTPDFLGTTQTTGALSVGGNVSGNIATQGQSDWFKINLTAGNAYVFNASGNLTGAAVTVYDANGNQLVSGTGSTTFDPSATGSYYVGASGSGTGAFTLSATGVSVDFLGNTSTSGTVAVGGAATGSLTHAGQSDWFKVALTAGTQYSFTVGGGTLSSPEASLYDSTGKLLIAADGGGSNGNSQTSFTATTSGTYYVSASSTAGNTGTFTVAVAATSDDSSANTSTSGQFYPAINAATAVSENTAHTLVAGSGIIDSAANVQANIDGLGKIAAGTISSITLTDSTTPTITVTATQMLNDAAALQAITSSYTLNISGFSTTLSQFDQGQHERYVPGVNHSGSNQVTEITSVAANASAIALGSGFNVVLIDGAHSISAAGSGDPDSFSFNVDANGTVNLLDNNTGHSVSITGDSYLVFQGGSQNADASYQSIYFVGGSTYGQIVSLYNAAFLRQPDLIGLEYYAAPIAAGSLSLHQTALYFLASPEFQNDYPTASLSPDAGGPHDQAFITTLYNNVLNRSPAAFELSYYANALAAGTWDRAQLLINFALSPENQNNISGLLVNTNNGAYADSNDLLGASTVLNEVSSGGTLNTAAIDPNSVTSGVTANGITASGTSITLSSSAPTETVQLSANFTTVTVSNSGSTVIDGGSGDTINLNGAANTTLSLGHNGADVVNLLGGTNSTIYGFTPGSGIGLNIANSTDFNTVQVLNGTTKAVNGASLSFGSGTSYVVYIGTVADNTAATTAAAANKVYTVSEATGTGTAAGTGEYITFLAKDSAGDTLVWFWGSTKGVSNGIIPSSSLAAGADANSNHLVDANELTLVATILGVAPTSLTANDLA
jgi:hypothetical protein